MLVRQHFDRKSGEYLIIARFASSLCKKSFKQSKLTLLKIPGVESCLKNNFRADWIAFTTCFQKQSHCLQSNHVGRNLRADINQGTRIQSSGFTSELQAVCAVFLGLLRFTAAPQTSSGSSVLLTAFGSVIYFCRRSTWFWSEHPQTILVRTTISSLSISHGWNSVMWFGHIIDRSFTPWPGELKGSKKLCKTFLLISLHWDWEAV